MMVGLLVAAVVVLLAVVAWLLIYRVQHPHTKDDLKNARKDSINKDSFA